MRTHKKIRPMSAGSVLVMALLTLAALALIMGTMLSLLVPRYNLTYQSAAWQESRMAAEAGVEMAMKVLNTYPTAEAVTDAARWSDWSKSGGNGTNVEALQYASATQNNGVASGSGLRSSPESLYRDNVVLSNTLLGGGATNRDAIVDVDIRAMYPDQSRPDEVWFRIRSLGTAGIQGFRKWAAISPEDTRLRPLSLNRFIFAASTTGPDYGTSQSTSVAPPAASRLIEVIAKPIRAFSVAILTDSTMDLGNSNNYEVDSYNSKNATYAATSPKGENGDIASNGVGVVDNNYEILINKATIRGDVTTNDVGINGLPRASFKYEDRITGSVDSGFLVELPPPTVPVVALFPPADPTVISPGSYTVQNLGPFTVPTAGKVVIHVTGNWTTGSGAKSTVVLAEGASVEIYVDGNIDFGNGDINVLPDGSVGKPANMKVYGTATTGTPEIKMSGNPNVSAAIYAPTYNVNYNGGGNGAFYGAVAVKKWDMSGGGNAGFHYDESLAEVGIIQGYRIFSYIEDWRRQQPPKKS